MYLIDLNGYALNESGARRQMLAKWNVRFQEGHTKPNSNRSSHCAMQESYTPYWKIPSQKCTEQTAFSRMTMAVVP